MPTQFDYPATGWSTGKMRMAAVGPRRGFEATQGQAIGVEGMRKQKEQRLSSIDDHKVQIQDAVNQVSAGDMTAQGLQKMLKKLGWTGDHTTGQFTDPTGQQHEIMPTQEANGAQSSRTG